MIYYAIAIVSVVMSFQEISLEEPIVVSGIAAWQDHGNIFYEICIPDEWLVGSDEAVNVDGFVSFR